MIKYSHENMDLGKKVFKNLFIINKSLRHYFSLPFLIIITINFMINKRAFSFILYLVWAQNLFYLDIMLINNILIFFN